MNKLFENRRLFLKWGIAGALGYLFAPIQLNAKNNKTMENPKLDPALVKDFVANCHGDLAKVKALYAQEPMLIYASHDWQNGDFENGIEAAGHVGNVDIARFLLSKGARINFFALCMLGEFEIVKKMLELYPDMLHSKGPHGFTPLHHATVGKDAAVKVKDYLLSLGASEMQVMLKP
jgi:ankyrin repeat protein